MKKIIFILFFIGFLSSPLLAQLKIGYIDSDTIMDNLPDVQDARQELDAMIRDWQTELRNLEAEFTKKKDDFDKISLISEIKNLGPRVNSFRNRMN
jgi:outer membrane protein